MGKRMMYIDDEGKGTVFHSEEEMIDIIKRDALRNKESKQVTTTQHLAIQGIIADAIKRQGGALYEDNGEMMDKDVKAILSILDLKEE